MTYSILARDSQTGAMGAAIQSHWFGIGRETLWPVDSAEGFVLCQAFAEPSYGLSGIRALQRCGMPPDSVLASLRGSDPQEASRQVAVMGRTGELATYTGSNCLAHAEHLVDSDLQASCQSNLMPCEGVPRAMLEAYRSHLSVPFAHRLMAALHAAQELAGNLRGQQSAAMVVVSPREGPGSCLVDLRVDDHADALQELERLLYKWSSYRLLQQLQGAVTPEKRQAAYRKLQRSTGNPEILFWAEVAMGSACAPAARREDDCETPLA